MKKTFGLWPKFALLFALSAAICCKFKIADGDLKQSSEKAVFTAPMNTCADTFVEAPLVQTPTMYSQVPVDTIQSGYELDSENDTENVSFWTLIRQNWGLVVTAFLGLAEVIVRLTPTDKDNSLFNFLKYILDRIIPNQRKEGGAH